MNEIRTPKLESGATYWALVFNPANPAQVRNVLTDAWVDLATAAAGAVAVSVSEAGSTGHYFASLPTGLDSAARYSYAARKQAGGAPAWTDSEDAVGETGPTPSNVSHLAGSNAVDGVDLADWLELMLAFAAGTSSLADNGDGTKTLTFRKQDGETARLVWTFNADGEREEVTLP